jgi:hypothetical protein
MAKDTAMDMIKWFGDLDPDLQARVMENPDVKADMETAQRTERAKDRRPRMTQDIVRGYAIKALAPLAGCSQAERRRILRQAIQLNEV